MDQVNNIQELEFLWIISLCLLLAYLLRILSYLSGWYRIGKMNATPGESPEVSIVIAVRDEGANLGLLIKDLLRQDYPEELLEIIVVDDHSSDKTGEIIRSFQEKNSRLKYLQLGSSETGKKAALRKGILAAANPVILNTDGDCRVKNNWVTCLVAGFSDPGVRMVFGAVIFEPDSSLFAAMQSLEFFSMTAVAAGAAGWGNPILCNAANLAYYREDFLSFLEAGEDKTVSGDDIFLMLWLKKQFPGSIRFSSAQGAAVNTPPAGNLVSLTRQRMRWTSKSRFYRDLHIITTALLVFGINVLLLGLLTVFILKSCFNGTVNGEILFLFIALLTGKGIIDFIFLLPLLKHYNKTRLLGIFIPLEIIYFMYVSLIGFFGQFLSFTWKGRRKQVLKKYKSLG